MENEKTKMYNTRLLKKLKLITKQTQNDKYIQVHELETLEQIKDLQKN